MVPSQCWGSFTLTFCPMLCRHKSALSSSMSQHFLFFFALVSPLFILLQNKWQFRFSADCYLLCFSCKEQVFTGKALGGNNNNNNKVFWHRAFKCRAMPRKAAQKEVWVSPWWCSTVATDAYTLERYYWSTSHLGTQAGTISASFHNALKLFVLSLPKMMVVHMTALKNQGRWSR